MMKKIVKTKIESLNEIKQYESKAILSNNRLKYMEDDTLVILSILDGYIRLKRQNKECEYVFTFKDTNSKLCFNLNDNNYKFNLDFKTDKLIIKDDKITIKYTLENVKYSYEVIIKEDL